MALPYLDELSLNQSLDDILSSDALARGLPDFDVGSLSPFQANVDDALQGRIFGQAASEPAPFPPFAGTGDFRALSPGQGNNVGFGLGAGSGDIADDTFGGVALQASAGGFPAFANGYHHASSNGVGSSMQSDLFGMFGLNPFSAPSVSAAAYAAAQLPSTAAINSSTSSGARNIDNEDDDDDDSDSDDSDDDEDGDDENEEAGASEAGEGGAGGASASGGGGRGRANSSGGPRPPFGRAKGKVRNSRPKPTLSSGLTPEERRAQRLERNRESARQSRKRKKQYLDLLEARVVELMQQISAARASHCAEADRTLSAQRAMLLSTIEPVAHKAHRSAEEEAALEDAAAQLVDRFGPDAPERRTVREFHFDQLARLILPPHTKFLLWLIHQPADFFADGSGSSESGEAPDPQQQAASTLWTLLCGEIGLTSEQSGKLRDALCRIISSPDLPRETWRLGMADSYLQKLRRALTQRAAAAQANLEALRSVLTPGQLIRYMAWMDRNRGRLAVEAVAMAVQSSAAPAPVPASVEPPAEITTA